LPWIFAAMPPLAAKCRPAQFALPSVLLSVAEQTSIG
jgi:hypothetical protein